MCAQRLDGYLLVMTERATGADPRLDARLLRSGSFDEATTRAVGKVTEAFEIVECARGHLYAFHLQTGSADLKLEQAIELLEDAGKTELARSLAEELLGRNVLHGRWTFQVVEEYDETYYEPFREYERQARTLTQGYRHLQEAEMKRQRRTAGRAGHEATPGDQEAH